MAHVHAEDQQAYYLEQLCTIGICGALGVVAILLWWQDMLKYILNEKFHVWVLAGGVALLMLVVVRAITLWGSLGQGALAHDHAHEHDHDHDHCDHQDPLHACGHEHEHDHDHHHDHDHAHAHGHDHGHDHGWNPWRYIILLLPIVLYALGLPNQGFSEGAFKRGMGNIELSTEGTTLAPDKGGEVLNLQFKELEQAAYTPMKRQYYEGKTGVLTGQYVASNSDRKFSLVRFKITCCAADAVPLNVVIMLDPQSPDTLPPIKPLQWVQVKGQIQFIKRKDQDAYATVLVVKSPKDIVETAPDNNPYLQ